MEKLTWKQVRKNRCRGVAEILSFWYRHAEFIDDPKFICKWHYWAIER